MSFWDGLSFALIKIVLPLAAIAALVFLCILLYQVIQTVKKANYMVDDVNDKISIFNPIFDGIANLEASYSGVGSFLSGVAVSASRARKNKKKREER